MKIIHSTGSLVAMLCLTSASIALADGLASVDDAVALADKAMKKIISDDIDGVNETVKPYSTLDFGELNYTTKRITETFKARPGNFGEPLSYVFVKKELIADTLLRVTFLEKFNRKPLQWDFFFYKPENNWLFWDYRFHGSAVTMFSLTVPPPAPPPTQR